MISRLCETLGIGYVTLTGDDSAKQKNDNMEAFRTDNDVRVIIANQSAGGTGVNLVEASYSIYYSRGFGLEAELQSEARNHRAGSEIHEKITRIDLIARETIDELVSEALSTKQNVAEYILNFKERL
jgi:SNF2 family DNA or RNA helicase